MNKLVAAYSGDGAKNYDDIRSLTPRWKSEVAAMESLLAKVNPRRILDCPFGTGRWIEQYNALGVEVVAVDLSQAMLDEANKKLAGQSSDCIARYHLVKGSIFDLPSLNVGTEHDLIVCVRFLNWVSLADAQKAFAALSKLRPARMVVGVSVRGAQCTNIKRDLMKFALWRENLRKWRSPNQYVHDEQDIIEMFTGNGFSIESKVPIFQNRSRQNFFYSLVRSQG